TPGVPAPLGSAPAPVGPSLKSDLDSILAAARQSKLPPELVAELERDVQREVLDRFPSPPEATKPKRTAADLAGNRTGPPPRGPLLENRPERSMADQEAAIDAELRAARPNNAGTPTGNAQVVGGETIKTMQSNLRNLAEAKKRSENGDVRQQGLLLDAVQEAIDRMMSRENPGLADEMSAVDNGYAKFKIVQRAAGYPGTQAGVFTPSQLLRAIRDKDPRKDKANFAQGEARMQDFGNAAKKVMGDTLPDSGTPTQALVAALMESLAGKKAMGIFGIPGGIAGATALAPFYSRGALSLGERMLMGPPTAAPLAQWLPYGVPPQR
ncbi:MAG TPA: hypothetical protein VN903_37110, partial [Polyangia bacterium]|nr:hypothetical protein [Polyangia bacterium]